MQGPHFKYLTRSYVEWLGLEHFPYQRPNWTCVFVPENAPKPVTMVGFDICVVYNHALYMREPDGLAWVLRSEVLSV